MNLVNSVFNLANSFMKYPKSVQINYDNLSTLAKEISAGTIPPWPKRETLKPEFEAAKILLKNSVNYCYWYGKSDIRPNNSSASKLGKIIDDCYFPGDLQNVFSKVKNKIIIERFPLVKERINHLSELVYNGNYFAETLANQHQNQSADKWMRLLIETFPGYGEDLFLKRASLFFIELYRTFGWFKDDMNKLFVPADYQLPKILEKRGVLTYSYDLINRIKSHQLIPKNSIDECEIRSATILACDMLSKKTELNIADIDSWLWLNRDSIIDPFHLTITTDY